MTESFANFFQRWRFAARQFSQISFVDAALHDLHAPHDDDLGALRKAPWLTLLMVKWVLQDRSMYSTREITAHEFGQLRQLLWEHPAQTHGFDSGQPLELIMRQLIGPQLPMQRKLGPGFLRDFHIIKSAPEGAPLSARIALEYGVSFDVLLELALLTLSEFAKTPNLVPFAHFNNLASLYGADTMRSFLNLVSRDFSGLTAYVRSLARLDKNGIPKPPVVSEMYEFPSIARFPLLEMDGAFQSWFPAVLHRGFERLVQNLIGELADDGLWERFSRLFEKYVADVAAECGNYVNEARLQSWTGEGKVCDGALVFDSCVVLIEAKARKHSEQFMAVGNAEQFRHKAMFARNAIDQCRQTSHALLRSASVPSPIASAARICYALIVTNTDFDLSNGTSFEQMCMASGAGHCATSNDALPSENIYFVPVDAFEWIMEAHAHGDIELPAFLSDAVSADAHLTTRTRDFTHKLHQRGTPFRPFRKLDTTKDEAVSRVAARFPQRIDVEAKD